MDKRENGLVGSSLWYAILCRTDVQADHIHRRSSYSGGPVDASWGEAKARDHDDFALRHIAGAAHRVGGGSPRYAERNCIE